MKRPAVVGVILLIVAITVTVSVLVMAQGEGPTTSQDGVAAGGGQRTSADESITLTDVIGLAAVGHSSSGTPSLDLFAGLVLPGGIPPYVITGTVSGLGPNDGTLNAMLADMGTADTVTVSFLWDSDSGAPYTYSTVTQNMSGTGAFGIPITGLLDNKRYYYRAVAESTDGYVYGEEKSFLTPNRAGTIYVDSTAAGDDNGTSWDNAYQDLQSALSRASNGDELWVAAGTYRPGDMRADAFCLKNQVGMYGGFTGTEGTRTERNWKVNQTILSGDIGTPGDSSDNCYHVVSGSGVGGSGAVLDGFTIANGNADGLSGLTTAGGGMVIMNCAPTITNCVFTGNTAVDSAGGMYVRGGSPVLHNCDFNNNMAEYGGALYLELSELRLGNCTFWNNTAIVGGAGAPLQSTSTTPSSESLSLQQLMGYNVSIGGAILNDESGLILINCAFTGNSADSGRAIYNASDSSLLLTNTIIWGNNGNPGLSNGIVNVTFSDINGGTGESWFGAGCIDMDPLWGNPAVGNLHLQNDSPCIDTGTNTAVQDAGILEDYEGQSRIIGGMVDMGPDEFSAIFVDAGATGDNNGDSWTDAYVDLQDALAVASYGAEIWVAGGTYTPGNNRADSFRMKNEVEIYGGFPSSGNPEWEDRDWYTHVTTLSGDIGTIGDTSDNCYHVLYHPAGTNLDNSALLDGFVICGGNADGNGAHDNGAGMCNSDHSSPMIVNCVFSDNTSQYYGGGIYNTLSSSPRFINCIFADNTAYVHGGAVYNASASAPDFTNCTFSGNTASSFGGAIYNSDSSPSLANCILWGDDANPGTEEIEDYGTSTTAANDSNIWLSSGTYPGNGNINQDPVFANPAANDFRIKLNSPCIDSGSNSALPVSITFDIEGDPRILNGDADPGIIVDMGADEVNMVILTTASSTGGSVIDPGEGSNSYIAGSAVSIVAEANPCYQFVEWTGTGTPAITNTGSPNTEILMTIDYTAQAEFVIKQYNFTIADDGNGVTTPASGVHGPYDCGTQVTINAIPNSCYSFDRWIGDTSALTGTVTQAANSVIIPEGDVNLTATFLLDQYTLTLADDGHGTINPYEGAVLQKCGTTVSINATSDPCYTFVTWTGDITYLNNPATQASNSVTMPEGNVNLTATFSLNEYNLTLTDDGHGTVSPYEGTVLQDCGTEVAINVSADSCYSFDKWIGGGAAHLTGPVTQAYNSVIVPDEEISLTATFKVDQYNLTLADDGNGAVTPYEGTLPQNCGATVNINASGNTCYEFYQWTGDIAYLSAPATQASNSITLPEGDVSLTATFVVAQYNLTLADDGHATVTPYEGTQPQNCGNTVDINAFADTCYAFNQWIGDGTAYLTGPVTQGSNSVTIPELNIGLTATFVLQQYDLAISSSTGGSVTVPGEGTFLDYDCGTEVAILAVADPNYQFVNWTGSGSTAITNPGSPDTTITMNGDYSITANFELTGKIVDIYINLQGGSRPVSGWEVPINVGFYPPNSPESWLLDPASATYYFSGTTTLSFYGGGTRAYFQCPQPVAPGTYDITTDSATTLLNVRRAVGIW